MTTLTSANRRLVALLVAVALATTLIARPAEAATPTGTAVCASEMVNITAPVDGQSHTFLRIHFWNGSAWQKWTEGTFTGPIISGSVMVNEVNGWYWAPKGRAIHVQLFGYHADTGWTQYGVGHGQQFGSRTASYCQA